jgi:hypothetical protein
LIERVDHGGVGCEDKYVREIPEINTRCAANFIDNPLSSDGVIDVNEVRYGVHGDGWLCLLLPTPSIQYTGVIEHNIGKNKDTEKILAVN